jgi:hypothetical protein
MKKLCLFSLMIAFILVSTTVYSAERVPLGEGNVALKLDYISFTDDHLGNGLYIGLEGYGEIMPNLYLGGNVGTAANVTIFGENVTFVPIELNLKYAIEAAPKFVIDFGTGASYIYTEIQREDLFLPYVKENDWLFGGQIFAELAYKINKFFIGINGKYQITQDFKDENVDLNNWRFGLQIGMMF